jgi:hypothetical protein
LAELWRARTGLKIAKSLQKSPKSDKAFRRFLADFRHFLPRRGGKKGRKRERKGRIAGDCAEFLAENSGYLGGSPAKVAQKSARLRKKNGVNPLLRRSIGSTVRTPLIRSIRKRGSHPPVRETWGGYATHAYRNEFRKINPQSAANFHRA